MVFSGGRIPTYEALPCRWGPTENLVDIRIDGVDGGSRLAVTQNLAERQNISERGHQAARMADVYSTARVVIVWLGPERDGSALAIGAMTDRGSGIQVNWTTKDITPLSGEDYHQWSKEPLLFTRNQDTRNSIARLLDRAWFTRLWIWQEIRLARNGAEMRCGYDSMSWDSFRSAILCLQVKPTRKASGLLSGIERVFPITYYNGTPQNWHDLFEQTSGCQYSDDRDRVYANLSLIRISDRSGLEPDYSKSTIEVYKRLFVLDLNLTQGLRLVSQCELGESSVEALPS